jgi:phage-related protein|tara:strand:+ start:34 stop:507 length:474 start_codon:yes stop_codon:yes gene_type:complete
MSTAVGLTTFLTVRDSDNKVQHRFQNSQPGETITKDGQEFSYLSFIYQGAAKNRTGDNMEAQLVLSNNLISMSRAHEAVKKRWNIEVSTCSMKLPEFTVARTLTTEFWIAASLVYDFETVEITLSSSIDAVGTSVPHRVLTTSAVGALPTSGQISNL